VLFRSKSSFASPDTSYTFDALLDYFKTGGSLINGMQLNVGYDQEVTLMDIMQDVFLASGVMFYCSHVRADDRRLKVTPNRTYTHATDNPASAQVLSTVDDVSQLSIVSEANKIKNLILLNNFIPGAGNQNGYIETIRMVDGAGNYPLAILQDDDPSVVIYNSHSWADSIASKYLDKLKDAWEDVRVQTDCRGLVIECADYVRIYDHKHREHIVIQVYNLNYSLDGDTTEISGKKVYSWKENIATPGEDTDWVEVGSGGSTKREVGLSGITYTEVGNG
jgi:hypothetical protein